MHVADDYIVMRRGTFAARNFRVYLDVIGTGPPAPSLHVSRCMANETNETHRSLQMDAFDRRLVEPASNMLANAHNLLNGITCAFGKAHFSRGRRRIGRVHREQKRAFAMLMNKKVNEKKNGTDQILR